MLNEKQLKGFRVTTHVLFYKMNNDLLTLTEVSFGSIYCHLQLDDKHKHG